jgi:(5-formylfuran-3-yl)methyl phosphate synthase
LVSAQNMDEAIQVLDADVDWLDLKDPTRGPLGRPDVALVAQVAQHLGSTSRCRRWSVAGGELLDWDVSRDAGYLDLLGNKAAIKWALAGCASPDAGWRRRAQQLCRSLANPEQMILVHYADFASCHAPDWTETLAAAVDLHARFLLIDTAFKNGKTLLHHYSLHQLQGMVEQAAARRIGLALAGSLRLQDLASLSGMGAEWLGVRGAVCDAGSRSGPIQREKLEQAVAMLRPFGTTTLPHQSA